ILPGGRAQPVHIVTEIDIGEIAAEDFVLRKPQLEPTGDEDLLNLAGSGSVRAQERKLRKLLRDRASALPHSARAHVEESSAGHTPGVDAEMGVESPVLDRDEGTADVGGHLRYIYGRRDDRPASGDGSALRRQESDAGGGDW